MKAIILAAGKGTRMHPLTLTRPKCMLPLAGKPILEHNMEQLKGLVDEIILVVGYQGRQVRQYFGGKFQGLGIRYAEQREQNGTGHALLQARDFLKGKFLVMNGDDLYCRQDIESCLRHDLCVMGAGVDRPECFGVLELEGERLAGIVEKPKKPKSSIVNTGLYVLDKEALDIRLEKSPRGEMELTDLVSALVRVRKVVCEKSRGYWMPLGYPWDLLDANEFLLKEMKGNVAGEVEEHAVLKGAVAVGKGTIVKGGAYIEGPVVIGTNCKIGPNCYIRPGTSVGNGCKIGNGVEVKNCILGDNVSIGHISYFGDSVLGSSINIGAGTVTANLRHDQGNVKSAVSGKVVDTGRKKFGSVIGDGVHTGIHTSIYPGRKIWPKKATLPGQVVKKDLM